MEWTKAHFDFTGLGKGLSIVSVAASSADICKAHKLIRARSLGRWNSAAAASPIATATNSRGCPLCAVIRLPLCQPIFYPIGERPAHRMGQSQSVVFPPRWPAPLHMQCRFVAPRSARKGGVRQAPLQEISFSQISRLWPNRKQRHYVTDCICHIAQAKAGRAEDLGLASKIPALGRIGRWRIVRLWLCAMGALAAHAGVFCLTHPPYY